MPSENNFWPYLFFIPYDILNKFYSALLISFIHILFACFCVCVFIMKLSMHHLRIRRQASYERVLRQPFFERKKKGKEDGEKSSKARPPSQPQAEYSIPCPHLIRPARAHTHTHNTHKTTTTTTLPPTPTPTPHHTKPSSHPANQPNN